MQTGRVHSLGGILFKDDSLQETALFLLGLKSNIQSQIDLKLDSTIIDQPNGILGLNSQGSINVNRLNIIEGTNTTINIDEDNNTLTIHNSIVPYTHPIDDGTLHVPATGYNNEGKFLRADASPSTISWEYINWDEIINIPTSFKPSVHSHDWNQIVNSPTTLAGYGISDAINIDLIAAPRGVASLDEQGKVPRDQLPPLFPYILDGGNAGTSNAIIESSAFVPYTHPDHTNMTSVRDALNLLLFKPLGDSAKNLIPSYKFEKGRVIDIILLSWQVEKNLNYQEISHGIGQVDLNLRSYTHSNIVLATNTDYRITLRSTDNEIVVLTTTIRFHPKVFWGLSVLDNIDNYSQLDQLNSKIDSSKSIIDIFNAVDQYLYIAHPASYGLGNSKINGFIYSGWDIRSVNITNDYGYSTSYYIYRSIYKYNGTDINLEFN